MFLSLEQVHRLHAIGLEDHGGSPGVRDVGLLESALASAQNAFLYGGGDIFDVAEAQAYLDGNKRVGIMTALTYLAMQGYSRRPSIAVQEQLYDAMIAIAKHELDKPVLALLLRRIFQ